MRLVGIWHVWDDYDLLEYSTDVVGDLLDGCIIVYSETSNFGELSPIQVDPVHDGVHFFKCEPDLNLPPAHNERAKRNFGLQKARELGYTHFLNLDSDELYDPAEFLKEKERLKNDPNLAGTVCRVKTYFKHPTLTIGYDVTLVPFIHKITPELRFEWNTKYPYAFEGIKREIRIDPTRQMNINSGVERSEITMHHFSWIRADLEKKIRNSTARQNIERSTVLSDYRQAKPGYYCEFYRARLEACENLFNLPEIIDDKYSGLQ